MREIFLDFFREEFYYEMKCNAGYMDCFSEVFLGTLNLKLFLIYVKDRV